jgi:hypothetical protein
MKELASEKCMENNCFLRTLKFKMIDYWNSIQFAPILCCFAFSFCFIFIQMDHIASNVLTAWIEKNMIFPFFYILINLPSYYVFQAPSSFWDFFQLSSRCPVHLKIGMCSLYIMLNNNFNFHTPWDSQNPYYLRLQQKQALSTGSNKTKTTTFNIIIS